jgi:hypothetical protein
LACTKCQSFFTSRADPRYHAYGASDGDRRGGRDRRGRGNDGGRGRGGERSARRGRDRGIMTENRKRPRELGESGRNNWPIVPSMPPPNINVLRVKNTYDGDEWGMKDDQVEINPYMGSAHFDVYDDTPEDYYHDGYDDDVYGESSVGRVSIMKAQNIESDSDDQVHMITERADEIGIVSAYTNIVTEKSDYCKGGGENSPILIDVTSLHPNKDFVIENQINGAYSEHSDDTSHPTEMIPVNEWSITGMDISSAFIHANVVPVHPNIDMQSNSESTNEESVHRIMVIHAYPDSDYESINDRPLTCSDVLLDSGANMSACSPELVTLLDYSPQRWPRPRRVEFGNGTVAFSEWYVNLGPFLGNTAIIDSLSTVIASVSRANINGFAVSMGGDLICRILSKSGVEVCQARLRRRDLLYYAHISDVLSIPVNVQNDIDGNGNHPPVPTIVAREDEIPSTMNNVVFQPPRRRIRGPGRVTKELSNAVMWIHKRLNHCSPKVMASALRSQAWLEVNITAAQIEQVFSAHDCVTCMLSRHTGYIGPLDQVEVIWDY